MAFDLRTIYAMTAIACLVLGLVQGAAYFTGRFGRWLVWWSASNILLGLASCLIVMRDVAPDFLTISIGNALTLIGYLLLPVTIREFAGRRIHGLVIVSAAMILSLPFFLVLTAENQSMQRIVLASAICALMDMLVAWEARGLAREEGLYSADLAAGLFALTATLYAFRSLSGWWGSLGNAQLFHGGDNLHTMLGLVAMLLVTLRSMVIMMMATERTQLKLENAAYHDPLTGVFNRAGISRAFEALSVRPLAALLIDIDHFKQLNDSCGHAMGDEVLKAFASAAGSATRPGDLIARHGGDEFVVVVVERSRDEAAAIAQTIRREFALHMRRLGGCQGILPTISIGVAMRAAGSTDQGLEALLQKADQALYRRKRDGRDGVDMFIEELQAA